VSLSIHSLLLKSQAILDHKREEKSGIIVLIIPRKWLDHLNLRVWGWLGEALDEAGEPLAGGAVPL
jgi:hypothetical protein